MMLKWPVIALISIIFPLLAFSQSDHDPMLWDSLETAIKQQKNLVDIKRRLGDIEAGAQATGDHITYARARYYQLLITDAKTEDSLFFRNSAFIDSILQNPRTPAGLRVIMHVMQAHRLTDFHKKLQYKRLLYETKDLPYNYATFSNAMLDSAILDHYEQAKSLAAEFNSENPETFAWLSSNPLVFLFKPTMQDLIEAELIAHYAAKAWYHNTWKELFSQWLKLSPDDLVSTIDTIQPNNRGMAIFRQYHEWLSLHQKDSGAFFFIESLLRKYLYEKTGAGPNAQTDYEKYLLAATNSPFREVKAHAVYQLCLLWYSRAGANGYNSNKEKFPPAKALELYENNKAVFDDFSYLGHVMEAMKTQILEPFLFWKIDDHVLPDEPVLTRIEYKNTAGIYYRIIPLHSGEQLSRNHDTAITTLLKKPYLRSIHETLPATNDLDVHRTFLKIDPLPPGSYAILFNTKEITGYDMGIAMLTTRATQIAIVASDNRAYVLNRKTGRPLEDATVSVTDEKDVTIHYQIDSHGFVPLKKKEEYTVEVTRGSDTAIDYPYVSAKDAFDDLYNKKEDDLLDYYIDHAEIMILTDRSIYRPGQTVYYKGIITTLNPYTGAKIIVTKKNLLHGLFRNFLKKWLREEEPEMYITDAFNRNVDTIPVKLNEYGSMSGSFRLPATAPTGFWHFEGDIDSPEGSFSVEEYKRPTFEFKAEPPAATYLPGDAVSFKLKVRSFAGSPMANTKITYSISRQGPYNLAEGKLADMQIDSTVSTGENGLVEIVITDTAIQKVLLPDSVKWEYYYALTATATDLAGESHELNRNLFVSSRPVSITIPMGGDYYLNDLKPVAVTAKDLNKVVLSRNIQVKVFRKKRGSVNSGAFTNYADQWKYLAEELAQWFPQIVFRRNNEQEQEKELVFETTIHTGAGEKLHIPASLLKAGEYTVWAACYDNNILRGEAKNEFTLFDTVSAHLPGQEPDFFHIPVRSVKPGDNLQIYTGSAFDSTWLLLQIKYYSVQRKKLVVVPVYREQLIKAGVHAFTFRVPKDATDHLLITSLFIRNNEVCSNDKEIWINQQSTQPVIVIEQFRSKLTPGQQTTFSVSVKTKDHNVAAELMSTCYDASLDKLEYHRWDLPRPKMLTSLRNDWPSRLYTEEKRRTFFIRKTTAGETIPPVWWMRNTIEKPRDYYWELDEGDLALDPTAPNRGLTGSLSVTFSQQNGDGLNELVVIGYGTSKKQEITGQAIPINGDNPVIKEPIVKVRSNFSELAFFYPAVYADKDGYYRFTFTMPESLTEWNWKLFAHTKKAQYAYAEQKLYTQLPFMVVPNMPKLLYQGDQIVLKSRISNLDSLERKGKTICKVEDAVTGEDLTAVVVKVPESRFEVAGNSNTLTGTVLNIPKTQLNPVKILIKAMAGDFGDGEEHIIPVLTGKILVKQAVPFYLSDHRDTLLSLPKGNEAYGVGLSIMAKPEAALLHSLSFLANYSFDCAEQTFNKMLANIIALDIMRTDKMALKLYATAKQTTEEGGRAASLPDELPSQAMPWLQLGAYNALQQKRLFHLLDTVKTKTVIGEHLKKLYTLQNKDGGLCWFDGGKTDPYISAYVLAGFGKLAEQADKYAIIKVEKLDDFIGQLVHYTDGDLNDLFTLYARSFWRVKYPVTASQYTQIENFIKKEWEDIDQASLYHQALLIITALQWFNNTNTLHDKALQQLEHIRQQAIEDPQHGIRWKYLADAADLTCSREETFSLLAEAFGKTTGSTQISTGIIKWILTSKAGHEWYSTKAAAAAINLLQKMLHRTFNAPNTVNCTINDQPVTVTDDLLSGETLSFVKTNSIPQNLRVSKINDAPVQGNILTWQFEPASEANQLNNGIQLTKHLFRFHNATNNWEPVTNSTVLKVSDELKVELEIETTGNLPYVYIDDKISGAFEALNAYSGYEYNGLFYYRSVRDAGMQFFVSFIPAGKTRISYEVRAIQEGTFTNGPASLQCMYSPEKAAYSNSTVIKTQE